MAKDKFVDYVNKNDRFSESEKRMLKGLWEAMKIAGEATKNAN